MKILGLIAEDQSDVEVVHQLIQKIAMKSIKLKRVLGHGCGKIQSKCLPWAKQLHRQGCSLLILVCDLDRRRLPELAASLRNSLQPCPIPRHLIVIPVREIEAWLLADHDAITRALKLRQPARLQPNPEAIQNPKERLRDLIRERSRGAVTYLNTVHNQKIAYEVRIPNLRRCPSFQVLESFVLTHLK